MWDIIVWEREDGVDFVPSCWGNAEKNAYKYPIDAKDRHVRTIIYECKNLRTNYKVCPARCIKEGITDLKKAQEYCKKGEFTSNVESESDVATNKNSFGRRSRKRQNDDYSYDNVITESDDDEYQPPARKQFSFPYRTIVATSPSYRSANNLSLSQNDGIINDTSSCISAASSSHRTSISNNPPESARSGTLHQSDSEKILRELLDIKFELKQLRNKMEKIENNCAATMSVDASTPDYFLSNILCENEGSIKELEESLTNPEAYKQLVTVLYLCGGETLHKSIYIMMGKLLGREVSLEYSCQGKKKKRAFCHLTMFKALTQAIRKRYETATEQTIKKEVSLYLAASKNRLLPSKRNPQSTEHPDEVNK